MDESGLIGAAKDGDLDSFNLLVVAYQDQVFNHAYRMMGEENSAADATQEAFISAFRNLHTFRGGSFRAWLFKIVTNACYDELRRRKRRPSTSLEPLDDTGEEIESPGWLADPSDTPEMKLERLELEKAIQNCLENLPEDFRAVVLMIDVNGMDYNEAAFSIGKPVGTVKSRLARARGKLRDCLRGIAELLPSVYRQGDMS